MSDEILGSVIGFGLQYRVVWEREGCRKKTRMFETERWARRFMVRLGPEPWLAEGKKADDIFCCDGHECGCGGMTKREANALERDGMPEPKYIRLEYRCVGDWEPTATTPEEGD